MTRLWQMAKWGPGDWWLVSNDRQTVYRFTRYREDGSLETNGRAIVGWRWRIEAIDTAALEVAVNEEPEWREDVDDLDWRYLGDNRDSRAECVAYVEELMADGAVPV